MHTSDKGTYCHILPQVLLRGFRTDTYNFNEKDTENKNLAKIYVLYLKGFKTEIKTINEFGGEYDFYQKRIETALDKKYEQPFGLIKQKIIKSKSDRFIRLEVNDFRMLIIFNAILWRRNEIHIEKARSFLDINVNNTILRDIIYNDFSLNIDTKSPVYLKTVHCYETYIVYNESGINFPLHNKHATVNKRLSLKNNIPEQYIFEPLTSKVMILHVRKEKDFQLVRNKIIKGVEPEKFKDKQIKLKSIIIKDEKLIKVFIRSYMMIESTESLKYYVCDDTNVEIIKECYSDKDQFQQWRYDFNNVFNKYFFKK